MEVTDLTLVFVGGRKNRPYVPVKKYHIVSVATQAKEALPLSYNS